MSEVAMIYSETVLNKAKNDKSSLERQDVITANTVTSESFKRSQLLTGGATDRSEVVLKNKTTEELLAMLDGH